ncbi:MAG: hypothetical protein K8T90_14440 [Planctomycetes bacterium]|nr:hypothetical protein [Planctomycetota bacterium]
MRDVGPPPIDGEPAADAAPRDPGPPRYGRIDGIIEGRVGDSAAARDAVRQANEAGYARLDIEMDGGRFSALPDADAILPAQMTDDRRAAFFKGLREFAAASDGPVESTLRCTEVFENVVRETLFLPDDSGRSLRSLTRERPVTAAERSGAAKADDAPPPMPKGRMALLAVLLVVAFGLVAWTGGWIDRVFSPEAAKLTADTAVFGDLVTVEVGGAWGDYEVKVRRGPSYPATTADVEALERAAADPARRAAVRAVADGGTIWLRLENSAGKGVAAKQVELRPLVERADRFVDAKLPGHMSAAKVRLALDAGDEFK